MTLILTIKIAVTLLFVVLPLLFASLDRLNTHWQANLTSTLLYRLYGIAVLALLVGYASGFWPLAAGAFPWGVAVMGLVSNGLAGTLLAWKGPTTLMRGSSVFFLGIAIALAISTMRAGS